MTRTLNNNKTKKKQYVFTLEEYNSDSGMLTTVWGPSMWHYLHTMSFNYPINPTEHDKKYYRDFILNLQYVLPCKHCRINLKKNFKQMPLTMEHMKNRYNYSLYIYKLHEHVNKMLNKKSNLTYDDVKERYEHFRARCTIDEYKTTNKNITKKIKNTIKGCTEPLFGKKSKCLIKIVPQETKCETFQIDKKCIKKRDLLSET
jgi:hypothetical protein